MRDCPYNKFDFKIMSEVCTITNEKKEADILCTFDYEQCEHYKEAHKPLNKKEEYYQPDLFGDSGNGAYDVYDEWNSVESGDE